MLIRCKGVSGWTPVFLQPPFQGKVYDLHNPSCPTDINSLVNKRHILWINECGLEIHGAVKLQMVEFSPEFMCRGENYCWPLIATLPPSRSHQQALRGKYCVWAGLLRTTEWIMLCKNFKNKTLAIFFCSLHIVAHLSCWWKKLSSISFDWYFARFSPSHSIHKLLISAN